MMKDEDEFNAQDEAEGYEPPAVVESARFETIASACGYNPNAPDAPIPCIFDGSGL